MIFFWKKRVILTLMVTSLLLNALTVVYLVYSGKLRGILIGMDLAELPKDRLPFQEEILARYRKFPKRTAEIIFAGDSLIGDGPWAEFYGKIHNRGIGGETTAGMLDRIDEVLEPKPRKLFLMLGPNNFAQSGTVSGYIRNYRTILERCLKASPNTSIIVMAVTPVHTARSPTLKGRNAKAAEANAQLKKLVEEFPGVQFIDLTSFLADRDGELRPEFTDDGGHLNVDGYLAIREPLGLLVNEPGLDKPAGSKP